ncbi:MAG TPA: DUF3943 domain-containing protein [Solimonas sp.]|nr:DUF3943 domain-containing protein [Solimonas sp.]
MPNRCTSKHRPRLSGLPLCLAAALLAGTGAASAVELPKAVQKVPEKLDLKKAVNLPKPEDEPGWDANRSYVIPAVDIVLFDFLLNRFDYYFIGKEDFDVSSSSIDHNLQSSWVVDNDSFEINQFGHPYQGSMYHTFARSAGLGYWTSLAYAFGGSAAWEVFGETTTPSWNDQISTGIGGTMLGEPLFRMATLVLEDGFGLSPFWREVVASAISPATAVNRRAWGDRFDSVFPNHAPAIMTRGQFGAILNAHVDGREASGDQFKRGQLSVDLLMQYGQPGKPGYRYTRPFDYFSFEFTAASANAFENISSRGLLWGTDFSWGDSHRAIWGLYGSYDYFAPQLFRVSSTAVSLGTTGQVWLSKPLALQYTAMTGIGWGAAGTVRGVGERDYHFGMTLQQLLLARTIYDDRVSMDFTLRNYHVGDRGGAEAKGSVENVARGEIGLTWRVSGPHGISLKYSEANRDAHYPNTQDRHQQLGSVSLLYTWLGRSGFGAVEWRPGMNDTPSPVN